jgi:hypothetical protein
MSAEVTLGDTIFTITELTAGEYDSCVQAATNVDTDETDTVALLKLMALKCISPKLSDKEIAGLPYRAWRKLAAEINRVHFAPDAIETTAGNA